MLELPLLAWVTKMTYKKLSGCFISNEDLLPHAIYSYFMVLFIIYSIMQLQPLVPVHQFDKVPSYYIFAGLVFVPLTQPYLHEYGEDWYNTSPRKLCEIALRESPKRAGEQFVILSQVCYSFCYYFLYLCLLF